MAPKKLSDSDRNDILKRYRLPEETTVTIADHYGVSTSTISRILKQTLSEDEYESLIQQKRSGGHRSASELSSESSELSPEEQQSQLPGLESSKPAPPKPKSAQASPPSIPPPRRRQRKRSPLQEQAEVWDGAAQLELTESGFDALPQQSVLAMDEDEDEGDEFAEGQELEEIEAELEDEDSEVEEVLEEDLEEDLEDDLELDDDLDEDDLDDEDFDDEDEDEDFEETESPIHIQSGKFVRILPLTEAEMPKTCYVVVDRASELITRPLRDFADLGQIPDEETQEKTLPIFDNHRVAKRFMRRMQRIVKVPDGRLFQKVTPYLQAKGITRLLIDGQVYSI